MPLLPLVPHTSHSCRLCNVQGSRYIYLEDLQALDNCRAPEASALLPPQILHVKTPLRVMEWEHHLREHSDREFAAYILHGIREGFRLGFDRSHSCRPATRNLRSVHEHPEIINAYLGNEVSLGRVIRYAKQALPSLPELTISPIGVIPKRNRLNKWRLIMDLSSPKVESVNDGISRTLCSLKYASIDDAVGLLRTFSVLKLTPVGAAPATAGQTEQPHPPPQPLDGSPPLATTPVQPPPDRNQERPPLSHRPPQPRSYCSTPRQNLSAQPD